MRHTKVMDYFSLLAFFMLSFIVVFGASHAQTDSLNSTVSNLCGSLVSILPAVSLIGVISSGLVYALGQFSGSELRARAAVWASALLAGSLVSVVLVAVTPPVLSTIAGSTISCESSGIPFLPYKPSLENTCTVGGSGTCSSGYTCCPSGACVPSSTPCPSYSQCSVGQQAASTCLCGSSNTCSAGQYCCSDGNCKSDCYPACTIGSVSSNQCRCNGNQVCSPGLSCCSDGTCKVFCSCPQSNSNPLSAECTCGPSASICYPSQYCCNDGTCGSSCVSDCPWSNTNPITSQCKCGGSTRSSGYCCSDGRYESSSCYDQCSSGLNVFDCQCGTSGPVCTSSTGRYCCSGTCQSGACAPACTDGQQGSCKCGTGAICSTSQYCYLAGNSCVPACSEGSISSLCKCGSGIYSSGFCCSGTHQSSTCAVACAEGAVPSSGCICGGVLRTSGYCCSGSYSATYSCCAQYQFGYCQCGGTLCTPTLYCKFFSASASQCGSAATCTNYAAVPSAGCRCGSTFVTSGYCCNNVAQATICYSPCTTNLQQNCLDSSSSLCSGSTYYYLSTKKCVALCSSNGQQNCLDSTKAYCSGTTYYSTETTKCTVKCASWGTSCLCDGNVLCSSTYHCWVGMHVCVRECGQGKITSQCYCGNPSNVYNPSTNPTYYCCSGRFQTTACTLSSVLGPCTYTSDCQSGLTCSNKKCCVPAGKTATSQSYCCSGQATISGFVYLCK